VAGTPGAAFHEHLCRADRGVVVSKAEGLDRDAYSGFQGTGLAERLRAQAVDHLVVGGLATDYCVKNTVLDALAEGFSVTVPTEAIRAVEVQPGDGEQAIEAMREKGACIAPLQTVLDQAAEA
jgi:nicotinamidase/pyrazinamidase